MNNLGTGYCGVGTCSTLNCQSVANPKSVADCIAHNAGCTDFSANLSALNTAINDF
jgi:hypothetical protein